MSSIDADSNQNTQQNHKPSHIKLNECCLDDASCNVILKTTDGDEINAHRCLLILNSEYFEKMFSGKFLESNQNAVLIKDISSAVMKHLINFIYTGILVTLDEDNVEEILNGADILLLNNVRRLCIDFLMMTIDHHNCLIYKEIAESRAITELQNECLEHALKRFDGVSLCTSFLDIDITQLTELIQSDELNVENEEYVYEAIIRWVKHDESDRKHELPKLLNLVRLVFISQDYLVETINAEPLILSSPECLKIVKKVIEHLNFKCGDSLSKVITNVKPRIRTKKMNIESSKLEYIYKCKVPGSACYDEKVINLTSIWSTSSNTQNIEWTLLMNEKNFLNPWNKEWEGVNRPNSETNSDW